MKHLIALNALLVALVGLALVLAGDADDSPGLGGIGLLVGLAAVVLGVRGWREEARGSAGG